ncbi:ABC transporter ATP-binding protein [Pseudonocardia sp. C8]|uniref:ABC transporter ATP-binding protein n=1 Tax=Pseudonocardia sp. C8 TaxID=2762759 RepID=UPI0016431C81|nr:ABC transporter ATP-binding protein [Pseudonocardia sp. C8]MBC3193438.1 ABC transporter ATP-binding protein [Pseudonocardia sp. C8]
MTMTSTPHRPALAARSLTLGYGPEQLVVDDLSVAVPQGAVTAIVGPNACGKSTLLRGLARLLRPRSGTVLLDGADIARLPPAALATRLGMLPQQPLAPDGVTVADLVARGRHPHQRWFRQWSVDDEHAVVSALAATGLSDLADRGVDELSGGQRQRVWIALALAQDPATMLLDEPTTFLDLAHQLDVLELLRRLNAEQGRTIVLVLHDLELAARYAHHLIAMRDGRVAAAGPPADVVVEDTVRRVFGVDALITPDPLTGTPLVLPRPRPI